MSDHNSHHRSHHRDSGIPCSGVPGDPYCGGYASECCGLIPLNTAGYAPCNRAKGHEGPCAHKLATEMGTRARPVEREEGLLSEYEFGDLLDYAFQGQPNHDQNAHADDGHCDACQEEYKVRRAVEVAYLAALRASPTEPDGLEGMRFSELLADYADEIAAVTSGQKERLSEVARIEKALHELVAALCARPTEPGELKRLREFVEWLFRQTWNGREPDGYEIQDKGVELGLLTKVPADQAFREEWDADEMFVVAWSPLAVSEASAMASPISRFTAKEDSGRFL